jgi:hypothetical protein
MPSSPETVSPPRSNFAARWNARLHYYLGLYFLFFIWLFAVTGLLLNHGMWGIGDMQRGRTTSKSEHRVSLPKTGTQLGDVHDLMRQLQVEGEIQWLASPADGTRFDFRVTRPGAQTEVKVDLAQASAIVERTKSNSLAIARNLHVFTGVRLNDPKNNRDWILTTIWAYAMDAVAIGLLAMVATGVWIWVQAKGPRWPGLLALGAGVLCCAWFVWGVALFGS